MSAPDPIWMRTEALVEDAWVRDEITLRDLFAAAALMAEGATAAPDPDATAKRAYALADAMLAERARREGDGE